MLLDLFPLEQSAVISDCGRDRYLLTRQVGPGERAAVFIMLNPSTADAANDDPTIRRCIGFARKWGFGRLAVLNLFAFRATDPCEMKRAADPVGPENREWFARILQTSDGPVVCGWGVHGEFMDQDRTVLGWLAEIGIQPMALGLSKDGHPRHPLYLSGDAEMVPYPGRR